MKPHKHAELIKLWADGAVIERQNRVDGVWDEEVYPCWEDEYATFRIKPEEKTKTIRWQWVVKDRDGEFRCTDYFFSEEESTILETEWENTIIKKLEYTRLECEE